MTAIKVNRPPEIQLPKELSDMGINVISFFEELGRYNLQMFTRTGGETDLISDSEANVLLESTAAENTLEQSEDEAFFYDNPQVSIPAFNATTVISAYTASAFDFINATNRASIKFPEFPGENDVIIIRNGDGTLIPLDGNGKDINGSSTGFLRKETRAIIFHYFIDTNEWFAR